MAATLHAQGASRAAILQSLRKAGLSKSEAMGVADFAQGKVSGRRAPQPTKPPEDSLGFMLADMVGSPLVELAFEWLLRGVCRLLLCLLP